MSPSDVASGPCITGTSPYCHAHPATTPAARLIRPLALYFGLSDAGDWRIQRCDVEGSTPDHPIVHQDDGRPRTDPDQDRRHPVVEGMREAVGLDEHHQAPLSRPAPANRVTFHRAARTPIDRAANEQEYRLRMFVAIGP